MRLAWNVYRHAAVYLVRGRVLVLTRPSGTTPPVRACWRSVLAAPSPVTAAIAALSEALAGVLRRISIVRVNPTDPASSDFLKEVPIDVPRWDLLPPPDFNPMQGCYDMQVHLGLGLAAAACAIPENSVWSAYWYNGFIYSNDIPRGRHLPSERSGSGGRTENPALNPQTHH